ncbi:RICIN domain-containing protein [Cohnella silvisoli]|uniref:RICIN domain-containing protein n=1 Tax=Cohnella silvisoli TaxID=2873699 RepID=A0ABV1KXN2_9BACL|nr:RICIN domain-containing protein [Cohnella silvisoli]MCD9024187.1 RICIN domain-containing protein [Cohnella silvisoli]
MRKICQILIAACLIVVSLSVTPDLASAGTQATYYVSPGGSDSNPGTLAQPFATLQKARDVVRTVNGNMTGDIVVYLRGGTYALSSALQLNSQDSGTNGYQVMYKNYPGETPIVSGGVPVTGWSLYDSSKNIYRAFVGTSFYSRHLYVNGIRANRARSETTPTGFTLDSSNGFNLPASGSYASMGSWENPSDIEIHENVQWTVQWGAVDHIASGKIYMKQPFWRTTQYHVQYAIGMTYPQVIENAYELLDTAGEWYLNRTTGYLYYKPLAGQNMSTSSFILPKLEMLIDGNRSGSLNSLLQNVQFTGITFSYTTYLKPGSNEGHADHQAGVTHIKATDQMTSAFNELSSSALDFKFAKGIKFENCIVEHIGSSGIAFDLGSQNNVVNNNLIRDISINGINIGDVNYSAVKNGLNELGMSDRNPSDARAIVSNNVVSNNTVTKIGNEIPGAVGIFGGFVKNLLIDHNTIYDVPYSGISVGWGWGEADYFVSYNPDAIGSNTIQYNRVYDYMKVLFDGGGIYTLGQQNGSKMQYNYISDQHNMYTYIYLDSGTSYYSIEDNVIDGRNGQTNYWFMGNDYGFEYFKSRNNDCEYNYFSSNLSIFKNPTVSSCANNVSVSGGNWDTHALDIMASAGAGNGTVSTVHPWKGANLAYNKTATASSYYQNIAAFNAAKAVDGLHYTRWASNSTAGGWLEIDFGAAVTFNTARIREYVDAGQQIKAYQIQYWNGTSWVNAYSGAIPYAYETDSFALVTASKVRLNISQTGGGTPSVWEFEVYNNSNFGSGSYKINNRPQNFIITPNAHSTGATHLIQWNDDKASDQYWQFVSVGSGYYKIVNSASGLVITPSGHATTSVQLIQWAYEGALDQQWQFIPTGDGYYKIVNRGNGLLITPDNHSASAANLVQATDAGGFDQHWGLDLIQ